MFVIISLLLTLYITYQLYKYFFPSPNIDPHGKYVLISGCDTGFGHALTIELDKQGFNVLAGIYDANNKASLETNLSSRATVFRLDITRQEDIDAAYDLIKEKTNVLHALVNNAGIGMSGFIDWISMEFIRKMMDVNFFGHVAMTKKFLPLLIAKKDSRVINVCSVAGILPVPMKSAYCASKSALESFSDCLRREMAGWGLRVSILEPGPMRTNIIERHDRILRDFWTKLSRDTQERWGEDFLNSQIEDVNGSALYRHAEDPNKVLQALRHAVMNTAPCIRYRPGWQASLIFFPLSMAPAWLVDRLFSRTTNSNVLPASARKQHKD